MHGFLKDWGYILRKYIQDKPASQLHSPRFPPLAMMSLIDLPLCAEVMTSPKGFLKKRPKDDARENVFGIFWSFTFTGRVCLALSNAKPLIKKIVRPGIFQIRIEPWVFG